ncbi:MAG: hypothetical protein KIT83_17400 [Bryobacterales bacterium]|nr:hypothetical protein [Bryobacterales bacterium]
MQTQHQHTRKTPGGLMDLLLPLLALLLAGAVGLGTEISRQLPVHWLDVPEVHRALGELEIDVARHEVRMEAQKARDEARRAQQDARREAQKARDEARRAQQDARREAQRAAEELRRNLRRIGLAVRESVAPPKLRAMLQSLDTRNS